LVLKNRAGHIICQKDIIHGSGYIIGFDVGLRRGYRKKYLKFYWQIVKTHTV
tara:strand:- start:200 stop:355 length:156 start_codon:yes stop_codon:yes gene_type:complete